MLRIVRCVVFALMVPPSITGCFSAHAKYPTEWPPIDTSFRADKSSKNTCPHLEGRFEEVGTVSPTNPEEMCTTSSSHYEWALDWLCDTALIRNLAPRESGEVPRVSNAHGAPIVLEQPDADTLRIVYSEAQHGSLKLHRTSGDFACAPDGLTRVQHDIVRVAANAGNPGGPENRAGRVVSTAAAGIDTMLGFGGVATLTRTFNRTTDGSLVMKITRSRREFILFIPSSRNYSTFVIWKAVSLEQSSEAAKSTPLVQAPATADETLADSSVRGRSGLGEQSAQYSEVAMYAALSEAATTGNYVEAYQWTSVVAATSRDPRMRDEAARIRDEMATKLDAAQLDDAEQRSRAWIDAFWKPQQSRSATAIETVVAGSGTIAD